MLCLVWIFFVFFKQKTAYEMRISDWSSDVCSSDLAEPAFVLHVDHERGDLVVAERGIARYHRAPGLRVHPQRGRVRNRVVLGGHHAKLHHPAVHGVVQRSEEHTSELQSLMRISYAVFCLKKKHNLTNIPIHT